jgi:cytochrome c oxidase subunit 6a
MLGLRTAARAARPAFRTQQPIQAVKPSGKRFTSGIGEKGLQGAADNAFNRERQAVKDHAAGTSGMLSSLAAVGGGMIHEQQ